MNTNKEFKKLIELLKTDIFFNRTSKSAFCSTLLQTTPIIESDEISLAATDGNNIYIKYDTFKPLKKDEKLMVFYHEIMHIALMHPFRKGSKDPEIWNIATDYYINLKLKELGYSILQGGLYDKNFKGMSEEQIYEVLYKKCKGNTKSVKKLLENSIGKDIKTPTNKQELDNDKQKAIRKILNASIQLDKSSSWSNEEGFIKKFISELVKPKVNWKEKLIKWFSDCVEKSRPSWAKPNRRYLANDKYLPALVEDEGKLTHIYYFLDISGSLNKKEIIQFHSELEYIFNEFKPDSLTVCQFNTHIVEETVFNSDNPYKPIKILPSGGTSYDCITNYLNNLKTTPAGVIIMTDLYCDSMVEPEKKIPFLWISTVKENNTVPFGELVYLGEEE